MTRTDTTGAVRTVVRQNAWAVGRGALALLEAGCPKASQGQLRRWASGLFPNSHSWCPRRSRNSEYQAEASRSRRPCDGLGFLSGTASNTIGCHCRMAGKHSAQHFISSTSTAAGVGSLMEVVCVRRGTEEQEEPRTLQVADGGQCPER